ncbi:hypothetical protein KQR56_05015 [Bacillus velezensis]|nr:hypothetical protein [Bacillus velezensis]
MGFCDGAVLQEKSFLNKDRLNRYTGYKEEKFSVRPNRLILQLMDRSQ